MNTPIVNIIMRSAAELRKFVDNHTRPISRGQYKGRLAFTRIVGLDENVHVLPNNAMYFFCGDTCVATLEPNDTLTIHVNGENMRYAIKLHNYLWHVFKLPVKRLSVHCATQYGIMFQGGWGKPHHYINLISGIKFSANRECINPSPFLGLRADKVRRAALSTLLNEFAPHYYLTHSYIEESEWKQYFPTDHKWSAVYMMGSKALDMLQDREWEHLSAVLRARFSPAWAKNIQGDADKVLNSLKYLITRIKEPYVTSTYVVVRRG